MTQATFEKYHKIESAAKHSLPPGPLVMQHKLDGANAGIERQGNALIVHSRNNAIARVEENAAGDVAVTQLAGDAAGFGGLTALAAAHYDTLISEMAEQGIVHIYGEWLLPHAVKYPEGMYRKFYVYDLLVQREDGSTYFVDPYQHFDHTLFGFEGVERMILLPGEGGQLGHAQIRDATLSLQEHLGYAIEGTVVKSYFNETQGIKDRRGNRFVYKDVLPTFAEVKGTDKAAHAALPVDQAIAEYLPARTIEKRYLDVVAANGGEFQGKLIPQILGRVWADFIGEFFDAALRDLKYPVVNTREIKRLVDARARQFALDYVQAEAA